MPDTDPGLLLQIALIAAPSPSYSAVTSPPVYFCPSLTSICSLRADFISHTRQCQPVPFNAFFSDPTALHYLKSLIFDWSLITPTAKFIHNVIDRWQSFLDTGMDSEVGADHHPADARTVRTGWFPPTLLLLLIKPPQKSSSAEIERLKADCPWAQTETKLELRGKEIVKEAKTQDFEQSTGRSIKHDANAVIEVYIREVLGSGSELLERLKLSRPCYPRALGNYGSLTLVLRTMKLDIAV
ncbi:hypothetical protein GG344DRAFT_80783 [Lentinula edodes]|nr:hypothetical protein GG344DRAFT_80783 [Lentinula edodes]